MAEHIHQHLPIKYYKIVPNVGEKTYMEHLGKAPVGSVIPSNSSEPRAVPESVRPVRISGEDSSDQSSWQQTGQRSNPAGNESKDVRT